MRFIHHSIYLYVNQEQMNRKKKRRPLSGASGSNARRNFLSNFQASCSPCVVALHLPAASSELVSSPHPVPDHQDGGGSVRRQGGTFLSRCGSVDSQVSAIALVVRQ
ncbi:unnamed protein product [Brassica rapa]|uniref:Uncharacterized protein n=1 Tax=Brassica campestris TaxID=3711 RepID=A0A3P6A328_BRACM|nr:unnamed protein product [Brassica rapa]VDC87836.1 unnamed protein product [Brassica rapa]